MKVRVRRNKGFKPVNIRLRFDNVVEYECFRTLMGDSGSTPQTVSRLSGLISTVTGVNLSGDKVEQCLESIMLRIWNKLPDGREGNRNASKAKD